MPFAYSKLIRQVGLRVGAFGATGAGALEAAYITTPLTTTQLGGSADFTLTPIKDACISAVARLVRAYANIQGHPFRTETQTANIARKGIIPKVDAANKKIIGVYGAITDVETGNVLTEQPVQLINSIVSNTDGFLKGTYYYYKIVGKRLHHTVTNAVIDVQVFDEPTERALIDANGDCSLDDGLFDAAWCAACAVLMVDDEFVSQASAYESYAQNVIAEMKAGATTFLPAPTLINTKEPVVS